MKIDILTLFPDMFKGPFDYSIVKKAIEKGVIEINIHDLRKWTKDKHKKVDDRPYGGGAGMVLMIEPIYSALKDIKTKRSHTILLTPQGRVFNQKIARSLTKKKHIILLCGHYEGFDERIREHLIDEELSIGNFILTGGELPAMLIVDAVTRLIPGSIDPESLKNESFNEDLKTYDFPNYTRPEDFKGWKVPEVLLTGNHKEIEKWRQDKTEDKSKKD